MKMTPELLRKAQELLEARRSGGQPLPKFSKPAADDKSGVLVALPTAVANATGMVATKAVEPVATPTAVSAEGAQAANNYVNSGAVQPIFNVDTVLGQGKQLNDKQKLAVQYGLQGRSFCLIGAAGTGKTTSLNAVIKALLQSNVIPPLASSTKYLAKGRPGIVCIAYTRRAVRQIARNIPADVTALTAHKLLEFAPVYYDIVKPDGTPGKTMRFEPQRHSTCPLPSEIRTIIIDEASMMSTELYEMVMAAIQHSVQVIVLGDLHQLPPVYGQSVLADKLVQWPVVELTEVYRQALESPIIQLATAIREGKGWNVTDKQSLQSPDGKSTVVINPWKQKLRSHDDGHVTVKTTALDGFKGMCDRLIAKGDFNEDEDVILMPFNKACGTLELNKHIANTLAKKRGALVHHVIAGYNNHFLAVGDRILYEKQECVITEITDNVAYVGKTVMKPGYTLNRWGSYDDPSEREGQTEYENQKAFDVDTILAQLSLQTDDDDKFNKASHIIKVKTLEQLEWEAENPGKEATAVEISDCGEVNNLLFSYALTVHKSQGSEWKRVFLFLHQSHHTMASRELLYTAITRAREHLYIICEPDRIGAPGTLTRGSRAPRIKGDTLEAKIKWLQEQAETAKQEQLKLEMV